MHCTFCYVVGAGVCVTYLGTYSLFSVFFLFRAFQNIVWIHMLGIFASVYALWVVCHFIFLWIKTFNIFVSDHALLCLLSLSGSRVCHSICPILSRFYNCQESFARLFHLATMLSLWRKDKATHKNISLYKCVYTL